MEFDEPTLPDPTKNETLDPPIREHGYTRLAKDMKKTRSFVETTY